MKFGLAVTCYTVIAIIVHCLFIAYCFMNRTTDCAGRTEDTQIAGEFESFVIWAIAYFPFLILCAFYTLLFRMCRSFLCSCWQCCGQDTYGKHATKCKICFEGVFGNPLIFAIVFIIWGIFEWISFGNDCTFNIQYGFLGDLIIVSLSLLLLCIYYFVRVKRRFEKKRNANIAKKYNAQQAEDKQINEYGRAHDNIRGKGGRGIEIQVQAPPQRNRKQKFEAEGSGQPMPHVPDRRFSANPPMRGRNGAPNYAASANGIAPYVPEQRRHSYNPSPQQRRANNHLNNAAAPAYASSAQGIEPYRPQNAHRGSYQQQQSNSGHGFGVNNNPLIEVNHNKESSEASIEISVEFGDDDNDNDLIGGAGRTRAPSISFPDHFKGHARRVSSGILTILKQIDAEPECSICMDDLTKGDSMGQLECGHTFHKDCIVEWLGNVPSCPLCRVDMKK